MSILTIQRWVKRRNSCRAYAHLTDITTSASFQRISGLLKSIDSASCKPTSDCYAESFVQSESHALSTNLPMHAHALSRYEIWKKDCLVTLPTNLAALTLEKNWMNQKKFTAQGQGLRRGSLQRFQCWADISCSS